VRLRIGEVFREIINIRTEKENEQHNLQHNLFQVEFTDSFARKSERSRIKFIHWRRGVSSARSPPSSAILPPAAGRLT